MSQLLQYYKSFQSKGPGGNQAPTFEDLAIDDELSELQRVVTYTKSSIGLQRCVLNLVPACVFSRWIQPGIDTYVNCGSVHWQPD